MKYGLIWVIGYSAFMMGMFVEAVDEVPKACGEPYGWALPLAGFLFMIVPVGCAYVLGFKERNTEP